MKAYKREIVIFTIATLATLLVVWFFFGNIEKKKMTVQTDLYTLVAPAPEAILAINRPAIFAKYILSDTSAYSTFTKKIPTIFLSVIQDNPQLTSPLFSFHPQGVIFYAKATENQVEEIENSIVQTTFSSFAPQKQTKENITYTYYPEAGNHFFGYYYYHGIFVASYSRKLLEQVAQIQFNNRNFLLPEQEKLRYSFDRNAPLNLMLQADSLNLFVSLPDSTQWGIRNCWLGIDIFTNEGNLCYFGGIPYEAEADSLYPILGDTLAIRLKQFLPEFSITNQLSIENGQVFYTGCSKINGDPD
ncbi:hypothetical protein [Parabacteroides sp. AM08-6]|uniref:hypothetical protein n=1 Tax=Parabacteroides sp. AM08-6 TaxID=2292053 RepID=UPI000F00113A|nr:hypothetical protein [Parabacteroides sp. AM08-6]RHJ78868.1 hypothetical protein DW103_14230 [Parabacteroides sp. AM08-6]